MGFTEKQKMLILQKVLPPSSRPVSKVSEESGVSSQTIYRWMAKLRNEKQSFNILEPTIPIRKSNLEKFSLLLESKTISEDKFGEWLRLKGLHTEHLNVWERELANTMSNKKINIEDLQQENKALKEELKKSKKENKQIEKALTEMSALYALKKKAASILGEVEED